MMSPKNLILLLGTFLSVGNLSVSATETYYSARVSRCVSHLETALANMNIGPNVELIIEKALEKSGTSLSNSNQFSLLEFSLSRDKSTFGMEIPFPNFDMRQASVECLTISEIISSAFGANGNCLVQMLLPDNPFSDELFRQVIGARGSTSLDLKLGAFNVCQKAHWSVRYLGDAEFRQIPMLLSMQFVERSV